MQSGELFISSRDGVHTVRVAGKGTFECAPGLRNLGKTLDQTSFQEVRIDLRECTWMDSTFMGILAMIGLRAKRINAKMTILNAGPQNTALLCGLGLKKLFVFEDSAAGSGAENAVPQNGGAAENSATENARMVLDAHETLMNVDEANVAKFKGVVSLVKNDLEKQDGTKKP